MKFFLKYSLFFCIIFAIAGAAGYFFVTVFTQSAKEVILPELREKNIIYVLETLTNLGLNAQLYGTRYDDAIPKYAVTFQDPKPGSTIKKGRDVVIYISKGPKQDIMPDLRQMPLAQARLFLEQHEFKPGSLSFVHSSDTLEDNIIAQYPLPFSTASKGSVCRLLVSKGPEPAAQVMPNLEGMGLEDAVTLVEDLNLEISIIRSQVNSRLPANIVLSQSPGFGRPVFSNTPVELRANHTKKNLEIKPANLKGLILVSHSLEDGFLKKHVRVETDMLGVTLNMVNEYFTPGKDINVLIPAGIKTKINIFVDNKLVKTKTIDPWKQGNDTGVILWN